eukprot:9252204-Pyramimonas_sp.AAC.1
MQWRGAYEKRGLVCVPPPSCHIRAVLAAAYGWVLRQANFFSAGTIEDHPGPSRQNETKLAWRRTQPYAVVSNAG